MRLGDIIIMLLILGGVMTIFTSMVTDTEMQNYYDDHSSFLNLSTRVDTTFGANTTYSRFSEAVSGQGEDIQNNTVQGGEGLSKAIHEYFEDAPEIWDEENNYE